MVREAIGAMWRGEAEVDSLNRLVIFSGLTWRQVQVLRAYRKYRMRVSTRFTEEYRNDAMADNPQISAALVRLFDTKFDPADEPSVGDVARDQGRDPRGRCATSRRWIRT